MRTCGYTTLEESFGQKLQTTTSSDGVTGETKIFNDPNWLVTQLKAGNLTLSYYSVAEKGFVSTTMDDDESITEREDSSAIKIAEQVYKNHMDKIEHQDKQFDMELTKLESEHNALQTEYDSVKKVISNNVEKSFNTFNA
jgi:membrane-associated HD superfamily phosphohydrolase